MSAVPLRCGGWRNKLGGEGVGCGGNGGGRCAGRGEGRRLTPRRCRPTPTGHPLPSAAGPPSPLLSSPLSLPLIFLSLSLLGFMRDEGTGVCTACGTRGLGCVGCGRGPWMGQILSHPGSAYPANTDTRRAHQSLGRKINRGVKII